MTEQTGISKFDNAHEKEPFGARDAYTGTIVFLLGAGCSAPYGIPVMNDFIRSAFAGAADPVSIFRDDYQKMLDFRRECLSISYVFSGRWWGNLEELFTQAHLRSFTNPVSGRQLCEQIGRVIWDVYRKPLSSDQCHQGGYALFSEAVSRLAAMWAEHNGPRPVVITTNYDMMIENSILLERPNTAYNRVAYTGPFIENDSPDIIWLDSEKDADGLVSSSPRPIEIVKLHGSVNWFRQQENRISCPTAFQPGKERGNGFPHDFRIQHDEFARELKDGKVGIPLIEPPLLGKTAHNQVIARQWQRAIHAIDHARKMYVIGYSFPETDLFMPKLLAEGLVCNAGLQRLEIVNSDPDESWWQRIESIFSPEWRAYTFKRHKRSFEGAFDVWNKVGIFGPLIRGNQG